MKTAYTNFTLRTKVNNGIVISFILVILVLTAILVKSQLESEFRELAKNDLEKTAAF